ncbi:MAG: hypothetical protein ACJASR_002173 [Psychroserpens sp.]|jgi:hypothetical protein
MSFGWGDENIYVNTPTFGDLTFIIIYKAMFLKSTTLIHGTRYKQKRTHWIEIKVNVSELERLNTYLLDTFEVNENPARK